MAMTFSDGTALVGDPTASWTGELSEVYGMKYVTTTDEPTLSIGDFPDVDNKNIKVKIYIKD